LNQFETVQLLGWSYLLKEVGTPFPSDISRMKHRDFTGILTAVTKLQEADRCHGDARVDNFVLVGDRWKIVDLRDSSPASPQRKINDFVALYKSFYPRIAPAHAEAMKGFVNDALSVDAIDAIFWGWINTREDPIEAIMDINDYL
jgi:Ser/Thr protein kinase RdoA (MazF antagonist)